jgi:predicted DNA-binding transcriptional regulator AlpA
MSTNRDELLTVDQVLDELGGVSRRTFFRWRELGRAPQCVKLPNGELRIWRSDLRAWLRLLQERTA